MKKSIIFLTSILLLGACANNANSANSIESANSVNSSPVSIGSEEPATSDAFKDYYDLKLLDSTSELIYRENGEYPHILNTYQEMTSYLNLLKEKSEVYNDSDDVEHTKYEDMISFLESVKEENFTNRKLILIEKDAEAAYNVDSFHLDCMVLKDETLYVHLIRDFMYKSMGFIHYQCYTFFVDSTLQINKVCLDMDESNLFD